MTAIAIFSVGLCAGFYAGFYLAIWIGSAHHATQGSYPARGTHSGNKPSRSGSARGDLSER